MTQRADIERAAEHLRGLMNSMYEGRSVRTPAEFRADLEALRTACEFMEAATQRLKVVEKERRG